LPLNGIAHQFICIGVNISFIYNRHKKKLYSDSFYFNILFFLISFIINYKLLIKKRRSFICNIVSDVKISEELALKIKEIVKLLNDNPVKVKYTDQIVNLIVMY